MFNEKIKAATQEAHQQLEKAVILELKQVRNEADYSRLLQKFHGYFGALEAAITPHLSLQHLPDLQERRKAAVLELDLKDLGATTLQDPPPGLPGIGNVYQAFGALYVMEGSVMGGPIIVKMLKEKSGIEKGLSFFSGYGPRTPEMWQTFRTQMNEVVRGSEAEAAAIDAANDTFYQFSKLFPR